MHSLVLEADALNLPPIFAGRYRGLSLRAVDEEERIILTPVPDVIKSARGMLKGLNYGTADFIREKQAEKEMENAE